MYVLRCAGLSKSFGGTRALDHVSVHLDAVEIVAIVGPNGSGKTTLLNVLTGFLRPDAGGCFYGPHDLTVLPPYRIAQLGISRTFQNLRLLLQVSVLENVLLARPEQRGEALVPALFGIGVRQEEAENHARAQELLEFTGLADQATAPAGALSYGQQKLLTLACSLATEAEVLLLDEPVAGIHPAMRDEIVQRLSALKASGKLVVFVEHDLSAVRQAADRVIVLDEGRVIAEGRPSEVLDRPEIMEAYVG